MAYPTPQLNETNAATASQSPSLPHGLTYTVGDVVLLAGLHEKAAQKKLQKKPSSPTPTFAPRSFRHKVPGGGRGNAFSWWRST